MRGCLHLKSGCTVLPDGRLLLNRAWIEIDDLAGFDLVDVANDEPWGGDVAIANDMIIAAKTFPKTIVILEREGFAVKAVDVSEFARAEGGVRGMSWCCGVGAGRNRENTWGGRGPPGQMAQMATDPMGSCARGLYAAGSRAREKAPPPFEWRRPKVLGFRRRSRPLV